MFDRMTVHIDQKPVYDIVLDHSFAGLKAEVESFDLTGRNVCIVTDTTVAAYYLKEVKEIFKQLSSSVITFIFPAGEESKNLDTVSLLYETLIEHRFERSDLLVALGGGVVGDLCGYGAATYLRGVDFIQIPTTLLAQVDSSIGGKTGVDFMGFKNMVGAFHMPKLVYINVRTLLTLSNEQFASGMGEVIKHGLIKDVGYYHWLEENTALIEERNLNTCLEMVKYSNLIKRAVVEQDPKEQGIRALLNFGHTFGHAIEKLKEFKLLHGHCVALGSLAAAYLACQKGKITIAEVENLKMLLQQYELPVTCRDLSADEIVETTKSDKKMEEGKIKFVMLSQIGDAYVDKEITDDEMMEVLANIL